MNKKILILVLIIVVIFTINTIYILKNKSKKNTNLNNTINNNVIKNTVENNNIVNNIDNNKEREEIINRTIIVNIDGNIYTATFIENETAKQFLMMLPQEFNMSELNGNEKYVYLNTKLPTNSYNPKHIEAGDIMLFGNNCLVLFYKSLDTSYSYTKIGHIENLNDLDNKSISIKFQKANANLQF